MQRNVNLVDLEKILQNEYLVVKIGFDTAENEPSKVSRKWGVQTGSARGHELCGIKTYRIPAKIWSRRLYKKCCITSVAMSLPCEL